MDGLGLSPSPVGLASGELGRGFPTSLRDSARCPRVSEPTYSQARGGTTSLGVTIAKLREFARNVFIRVLATLTKIFIVGIDLNRLLRHKT